MTAFLTLVALITLLVTAPARAQERVALVIGNGSYAAVGQLTNPVNDATDIGSALEAVGFEVEYGFDLNRAETVDRLGAFRTRARLAEAAIIYYAGHGIEVDRKNFMIPVDAKLASIDDVAYEAVSLDLAMGAIADATQLSLVIVDACRNNPFLAQMRIAGSKRSVGRGLRAVEPVGNTLVAYSARDGTVAADGQGRNSPYAAALIRALGTRGLEIGKLFRRVRDDVLTATRNEQEPFLYGSLSAQDFYFRPPSAGAATATEPEPEADDNAAQFELMFWKTVREIDREEGYRDYLARYPNGVFATIARLKLDEAAARDGPPPTARDQSETAVLPDKQPRRDESRDEPARPDRKLFAARDGYDIPGFDIAGQDRRGISLQDCVNLCARLETCRAFSYVERKRWCWPKFSIGRVVPRAGIKSAAVEALEEKLFAGGVGRFAREFGVDYPGGDLTEYGIQGITIDACRARCVNDPRCAAYSFVLRQGWCWPKRAILVRVRKDGIVSERVR